MNEWTQERRERLEQLFARPFTSRDTDKVRVADVFAALSEIDRLTARVEAQRDAAPTFWLVETPQTANSPARWWHPKLGWVIDWSKALRFARKEDAADFSASAHMRGTLTRFVSEHAITPPEEEPAAKVILVLGRRR